jgi:hypothetical protein
VLKDDLLKELAVAQLETQRAALDLQAILHRLFAASRARVSSFIAHGLHYGRHGNHHADRV